MFVGSVAMEEGGEMEGGWRGNPCTLLVYQHCAIFIVLNFVLDHVTE